MDTQKYPMPNRLNVPAPQHYGHQPPTIPGYDLHQHLEAYAQVIAAEVIAQHNAAHQPTLSLVERALITSASIFVMVYVVVTLVAYWRIYQGFQAFAEALRSFPGFTL